MGGRLWGPRRQVSLACLCSTAARGGLRLPSQSTVDALQHCSLLCIQVLVRDSETRLGRWWQTQGFPSPAGQQRKLAFSGPGTVRGG